MPDALLLQETPDHDDGQALLAALLAHAAVCGTQSVGLIVVPPSHPRSALFVARASGAETPATPEIEAQAQALARGRTLHAVVRGTTARLWLRGPKETHPVLGWRNLPNAARRHPLLPAWRAMEDGDDFLLGDAEASAHRRLLQAARASDVPALRRLAEGFAARPARLWRRDAVGIVLYSKGPQGDAMADSFEAVLLPVPDAGSLLSETGVSSR
jgi:hypothetical protein